MRRCECELLANCERAQKVACLICPRLVKFWRLAALAVGVVDDLLHLPSRHFPAWVRTRRRDIGSLGTGQTCEQCDPEELTFP